MTDVGLHMLYYEHVYSPCRQKYTENAISSTQNLKKNRKKTINQSVSSRAAQTLE